MFLRHLRLIPNSFTRPLKKLQKTFIFLLRETKNPLLLHPLSERERVLKTAETRSGRETGERGERSERGPFEKKIEKVLGGTGKGITFATRFREENR